MLSRWHTWQFNTPIAANLIASENRKRFSPPIDADTLGDLFRLSRRCGSFEKSCGEIAQTDGLTFWRFAAMTVENHRNGHSWRMQVYLIADVWHARYRRFYTPIAAVGENRNRCTEHTWRFWWSQWSAHKIAKCFITWLFKTATSPRSAKKIAKCVRISRWWKSLAIGAIDV